MKKINDHTTPISSDYHPFGMRMFERSSNSSEYRFGYQGSEKDDEIKGEGNSYTTHFRLLDPRIGRWLSIDPKSSSMPWQSPYNSMDGNPVFLNDQNGDSTFVTANENGTYSVSGGNLDGDDKGIYIQDSKGVLTGDKLGESITTHSFVDANDSFVIGAIIDPSSTEGQEFIDDEIIAGDPALATYIWNARNGKEYDFKDRGIKNRGFLAKQQFRYRGSITKDGKFGSARDFGNIGAGIVAGRNGLSWDAARFGFDTYQGEPEPSTTQKAQRYGYQIGLKLLISDEIKIENNRINNPGLLKNGEPKY